MNRVTLQRMREDIIELNGHKTRLLMHGESGPLVLFLHGFPEFSGAWREVFAQMDGFRCVAPDLRGYGISYKPPEVSDYSTGKVVADLLALLDHLGESELHLVGHDWGAAAAYLLSFANDKRIRTLTIMNGVHPAAFQDALADGGPQADASQYMTWLRQPGSEVDLAANDFEKLIAFFAKNMDMAWLSGDRLDEYKAAWQDADTLRCMVNWYRASPLQVPPPGHSIPEAERTPLPRAFVRVKTPHLIIWGNGDTALLPETRDAVKEYCDDLRIVEIDDADHWLHHQKPVEVADALKAFLKAQA